MVSYLSSTGSMMLGCLLRGKRLYLLTGVKLQGFVMQLLSLAAAVVRMAGLRWLRTRRIGRRTGLVVTKAPNWWLLVCMQSC